MDPWDAWIDGMHPKILDLFLTGIVVDLKKKVEEVI